MGYLSRKTGGEAEAPSSPTNFSFFFTSKFGAASRTWEIVASIIKATPRPQGNWSTCCLNFMLMFLLQHRLQSCIINMFTIFLVKFVIIQPSHLFLVIFRVIISSELQLTCKVKTILLCTLYIYIILLLLLSFIIIINYYCYLLQSLLLLLWPEKGWNESQRLLFDSRGGAWNSTSSIWHGSNMKRPNINNCYRVISFQSLNGPF